MEFLFNLLNFNIFSHYIMICVKVARRMDRKNMAISQEMSRADRAEHRCRHRQWRLVWPNFRALPVQDRRKTAAPCFPSCSAQQILSAVVTVD
jgi:hypothetical protein